MGKKMRLEVQVDGEVVYAQYPDDKVLVKADPALLLEVKNFLLASIPLLEAWISKGSTKECIASRE